MLQSPGFALYLICVSLRLCGYEFFRISEARALDLYDAGYKHFKDIEDAIVQDLIMVNDINPTVAREIIDKISNDPLPEV